MTRGVFCQEERGGLKACSERWHAVDAQNAVTSVTIAPGHAIKHVHAGDIEFFMLPHEPTTNVLDR